MKVRLCKRKTMSRASHETLLKKLAQYLRNEQDKKLLSELTFNDMQTIHYRADAIYQSQSTYNLLGWKRKGTNNYALQVFKAFSDDIDVQSTHKQVVEEAATLLKKMGLKQQMEVWSPEKNLWVAHFRIGKSATKVKVILLVCTYLAMRDLGYKPSHRKQSKTEASRAIKIKN